MLSGLLARHGRSVGRGRDPAGPDGLRLVPARVDQLLPDQEFPLQLLPDHLTPDQELPLRCCRTT